MALTALNRRKNDVNGVEPKKSGLTALNRKKAALTALNRKKSGVNGVEPEKERC